LKKLDTNYSQEESKMVIFMMIFEPLSSLTYSNILKSKLAPIKKVKTLLI